MNKTLLEELQNVMLDTQKICMKVSKYIEQDTKDAEYSLVLAKQDISCLKINNAALSEELELKTEQLNKCTADVEELALQNMNLINEYNALANQLAPKDAHSKIMTELLANRSSAEHDQRVRTEELLCDVRSDLSKSNELYNELTEALSSSEHQLREYNDRILCQNESIGIYDNYMRELRLEIVNKDKRIAELEGENKSMIDSAKLFINSWYGKKGK